LTSILTAIGTVLTLVLTYLAVAVSAHWFPWHEPTHRPGVPSFSLDFDRGGQSNSKWNSQIARFSDRLSSEHTRVVKLDLTFEAKQNPVASTIYDIYSVDASEAGGQLLYVQVAGSVFRSVEVGQIFPHNFVGQILTLELVQGPGSALGYVFTTPGRLVIDGYFQIGLPNDLGAGDVILDLIPVTPRN
jgi:hypothetical protein